MGSVCFGLVFLINRGFFPFSNIFLTYILFFQEGGSWELFFFPLKPFGGKGQEGDAWGWGSSGMKDASLDGWVFLNFLKSLSVKIWVTGLLKARCRKVGRDFQAEKPTHLPPSTEPFSHEFPFPPPPASALSKCL